MQDKTNPDVLLCDSCGNAINPTEKHLRLETATLWAGPVGQGVIICRACAFRILGVHEEAMKNG